MRFSGTVGYANNEETSPGVWTEVITTREYRGDVLRQARRLEPSSAVPATLNPDIALENRFSIVADAYAYENFSKMRYVGWNGSNWTITTVDVQRPRIILTVGALWNGNTA